MQQTDDPGAAAPVFATVLGCTPQSHRSAHAPAETG
ncbi:hypothetical protein Q31a_64990 [Aureliella helgolandensis]|uniref:Uncharacterized protein n=1 Tax=Aureliella helgolandensis TaxID=2527968 RepID=A0A518GHP1_9BACT|nr:hypothetical protein Q31a_64990 [Aureliella helgolandensis]